MQQPRNQWDLVEETSQYGPEKKFWKKKIGPEALRNFWLGKWVLLVTGCITVYHSNYFFKRTDVVTERNNRYEKDLILL